MPKLASKDFQKEERERDRKRIWRNYGWKLTKPIERNRYPDTGSTENPYRPTARHIIVRMIKYKDKEINLKVARE